MSTTAIQDVARMCLSLPGTGEKLSHGAPAFTHRDRIFCWVMDDHHGSGRLEVWIKAEPAVQQEYLQADPERFFRPPYVGPKGWVGVVLAPTGAGTPLDPELVDDLAELLVDGYLSLTTQRARAELDAGTLLRRVRAGALDPTGNPEKRHGDDPG